MKRLMIACAFMLSLTAAAAAGLAAPASADPATACRGVPEAVRDGSPITNPQNIRTVQEVKVDPREAGMESETIVRRAGARLVLGARPGLTTEWLQRIAECHLAESAAQPSPSKATRSPLDVRGAAVIVSSTGDGFMVDITSSDRRAAKEILARARALAPASATTVRTASQPN